MFPSLFFDGLLVYEPLQLMLHLTEELLGLPTGLNFQIWVIAIPKSLSSSLKIFFSDGGCAIVSFTEKLKPIGLSHIMVGVLTYNNNSQLIKTGLV